MKLDYENSTAESINTQPQSEVDSNNANSVNTIVELLNNLGSKKNGWWADLGNDPKPPFLFLLPCLDMLDRAQFLFLCAPWIKG